MLSSLATRIWKDASAKKAVPAKLKLKHNRKLTRKEFATVCALCDIASEVLRVGKAHLPGGIFWGEVDTALSHSLHEVKNKREIDASLLLPNRFRDFPTIIYQFDKLTPTPDFWVRRYIRLCKAIPERWHVRMPCRFGEIGWNVGGYPVNRYTATLQERINAQLHMGMERALSLSDCPRILEIGGGSGEMGYVICGNTPGATWYDCDLTQSLIYNAIHMAVWMPSKKHYIYVGDLPVEGIDERFLLRSAEAAAKVQDSVVNIPHFLLEDFKGKLSLNLALNAWSFSEMPANEVERYAVFIHDHLAHGGILIEQNGLQAKHGGSDTKDVLERIFPHRRCFSIPLLPAHGLLGGPMDAWARAPFSEDSMHLTCFDNAEDRDDLQFSSNQFELLKRAAKIERELTGFRVS